MADESPQVRSTGSPTRRQALNACDACRKRKTKCDERKPACGRCHRLDIGCSYVDTVAAKKGLSVTELTETLKRMDEKLDALSSIARHGSNNTNQTFLRAEEMSSSPSTHHPTAFYATEVGNSYPTAVQFLDTGRVLEELSLSQRHLTAPQHLLSWPCCSLQLSETDLQYPISLEIKRPRNLSNTASIFDSRSPLTGDTWPSQLSLSQVSLLTQSYFEYFHPSCLVLDKTRFYSHVLPQAMQTDFAKNYNTCIVLLVCALGSIAAFYAGHKELLSGPEDDLGIEFFLLARNIFSELETVDWDSVQCLLLMGMFFSAKLRVYDAWHVNHRACCTILILVPLQRVLEPQECQLFWIAYLQESQILAEFDLPASGMGKLASSIPLPLVSGIGPEPYHAQYQLFFLALISMRKLLNRVIFHLYSRDHTDEGEHEPSATVRPTEALAPSQSLIQELERQLEEWRSCLPQGLDFPCYYNIQEPPIPTLYNTRTTDERLRGQLMARYYSAKSILHRPFIYMALHSDPDTLSEIAKTGARSAVGCAFMSVIHSGILNEPLPLLLHPINSCRSLFTAEIQITFLLQNDAFHYAIPSHWRLVQEARNSITTLGAQMSPTVARDGEIIQVLSQEI